jgi:hypothetical protein
VSAENQLAQSFEIIKMRTKNGVIIVVKIIDDNYAQFLLKKVCKIHS